MGLPRKKLSLVHVAKSRLGLSEEDYRHILLCRGGVTSSRDLDDYGFAAVMREFGRLGFHSDFSRANLGDGAAVRIDPGNVVRVHGRRGHGREPRQVAGKDLQGQLHPLRDNGDRAQNHHRARGHEEEEGNESWWRCLRVRPESLCLIALA